MLPSLHDYLLAKSLGDSLISFIDTDDQRILQPDWARGTTGHTQPKVVVSDVTFYFDDYLHAKNLRDRLIPFREMDD